MRIIDMKKQIEKEFGPELKDMILGIQLAKFALDQERPDIGETFILFLVEEIYRATGVNPPAVAECVEAKDREQNPRIENAFTYHAPKKGQPEKYGRIRSMAKDLAYLIDELVPDSREKSLAMTKLEEATMWANAGIARN